MSDPLTIPSLSDEPRIVGLVAQFDSAEALLEAAAHTRDVGFRRWDTYAPYPIHGLDEAMGIRPSRLPWIVLVCGTVGLAASLAFQWWANAVAYPFVISGKPLFSLPANIPVTFEVTILLSAFGAFFGMLALNRLPRWSNPLLRLRRFRQATQDKFYLAIEANDPRFALATTRQWLETLGAAHVDEVRQSAGEQAIPRPVIAAAVVLAVLATIPPVLIAKARVTTSSKPRLTLPMFDMDFTPARKPQSPSTLFADGRAARIPPAGTVPRGQLHDDRQRYYGQRRLSPEEVAQPQRADDEPGAAEARPDDGYTWVEEFPLPVSQSLVERGQQRFNIYCAPCHGLTGMGNGLVSLRAMALEQGTWVPPTSLHADHIRTQPVGQLFHSITHGVRKMPAYGAQIPPDDRWAIVLYVRALQRARDARLDDVPDDVIPLLNR